MSFIALNTAITGLRTAQQQLSAISNNIANATTEGYTRKVLPTSSKVIDSTGEGFGVKSDPLTRNVDMNLQRELWTQVSGVEELNVKGSYLDTIEKFHGPTNKQLSISAQIAELKDKFAGLSDSPSDSFLLQETVTQAQTVAGKFNDFGQLLTRLRNDAQDDMSTTVGRINDLLKQVSDMNGAIRGTANLNRSTAGLEDTRDKAIKELSGLIGISTFTRGDGVIVVQTKTGVQLADERTVPLTFKPGAIGSTNSPAQTAAIYVGDPDRNPAASNITTSAVGGKLGGLIDLRDNQLVQYQAQADEAAHQLAMRFDAQGLRLFTDQSGTVPSDAPPNLATNPPTPVAYVGFASTIRVNQDIIDDPTLIQKGTYTSDAPLPTGSNEVIRRVIQFSFGNISRQEINGTTNLTPAVTVPATDLQTWLGLKSGNVVTGGLNLASFSQIDDGATGGTDMMEKLQDYFKDYPTNDQFKITFGDSRLGLGPTTITVDLSDAQANHPLSGTITNALDQIVAEINDQITAAGVPAGLNATATRNVNGQLVIKSTGDVTLSASGFAGSMGKDAFNAIGLAEKTYKTEDPYFDIQVGTGTVKRITLEPGETVNDLIGKLEYDPSTGAGVPGLSVSFDSATGRLSLRPGMDSTNGGPKFGGDIKVVSGPAKTASALATVPNSVSMVAALFGSYVTSGGVTSETSPVTNVEYKSETAQGSGVFVSFRTANLGASGKVATELNGNNIIDFADKMINAQAQDISLNTSKAADSTSLRDLIQQRFLDETGVNIDEELSQLIVIQTAYSASARAVSAAEDMFNDLLDAVR